MRKLAAGLGVVVWAFAVQAVDLPTMGWSSWNTYRVNISEELIKRQADALVDGGFAAVGYKYVNIDDGWFGGRDKDGRHTTNPKRFPNGLKPVVDYIHAKGLKAGAYSDAGENTCGSIWDNDVLGIGVGFYGHDEEDARWFFDEMDFDFIKIDFGGGTPQGNKAHVVMNEKERYTAIAKAITKTKKGAAGKLRMNVCCWRYPGSWVSEVAGSWRISGDVAAKWESIKGIIDKNSYFARFQKPGHYNDMDMLEVGRGLTEEEDKTHFGMWCMMASPLLIGCDLTTIKPETAKLLKNTDLIAIDQDPLGVQAEVAWRDWKHDIRVYAKPLAPAGSLNMAIALYNGTDDERTITAELDALGYDWNKVSVWDCFEHRAVTNACRTFAVKVPPHGTRIYRLAPVKPQASAFRVGEPCLQSPGETTMGVSWAVSGLAKGVVEYADNPDFKGARTARSGGYGLVPIDEAVLQVRLEGLKSSTRYWYRTVTTPFTSYENIYDAKLGEPIVSGAHSFVTQGTSAPSHFCVMSDTHEQWPAFEKIVGKVKALKPAVLVWNGDATNTTQDRPSAVRAFLDPPIESRDYAADIPTCFVCGNHDYRGSWISKLDEVFLPRHPAERTGAEWDLKWNFAVRCGEIALIGMDTGEDKPDGHPKWFGLANFEPYRKAQAVWLEKALSRPDIASAKFKVLFCHIPLWPCDEKEALPPWDGTTIDPSGFAYWSRECRDLWAPILERHGVKLVVCGHQHLYSFSPATADRPWAMVVGGGLSDVIEGKVVDGELRLSVHNIPDGRTVITALK